MHQWCKAQRSSDGNGPCQFKPLLQKTRKMSTTAAIGNINMHLASIQNLLGVAKVMRRAWIFWPVDRRQGGSRLGDYETKYRSEKHHGMTVCIEDDISD